jgi:hypothetical protein
MLGQCIRRFEALYIHVFSFLRARFCSCAIHKVTCTSGFTSCLDSYTNTYCIYKVTCTSSFTSRFDSCTSKYCIYKFTCSSSFTSRFDFIHKHVLHLQDHVQFKLHILPRFMHKHVLHLHTKQTRIHYLSVYFFIRARARTKCVLKVILSKTQTLTHDFQRHAPSDSSIFVYIFAHARARDRV